MVLRAMMFRAVLAAAGSITPPQQQQQQHPIPVHPALSPATAAAHGEQGLRDLRPTTTIEVMHFASENSRKSPIGRLQLRYPVITLDHSDVIEEVRCVSQKITISFGTRAALDVAMEWSLVENLVLVTNDASCTDAQGGTGVFFASSAWEEVMELQLAAEIKATGWDGVVESGELQMPEGGSGLRE